MLLELLFPAFVFTVSVTQTCYPLLCQAPPQSLSITLVCNIGAGKFLCRRSNLLKVLEAMSDELACYSRSSYIIE